MRKRADDVERTRRRITEAAVELHTTIGPANTTISAIAERAGVTRLTVYSHFPDLEQLFLACSGHWFALHQPPDPSAWRDVADQRRRVTRAIEELYTWYEHNGDDLYPLRRDLEAVPPALRDATLTAEAQRVDIVIAGMKLSKVTSRRLRAAIGHALDFWTWHSLVRDQGLSTKDAIDVAVRFVTACYEA
jgi:AcrR family transcriptional regulator